MNIIPIIFAVCALIGVILDLRRPPSWWRFIWWTISNVGNTGVAVLVAAGFIRPVNIIPIGTLYLIYLLLAIYGLIWRQNENPSNLNR